MDDVSSVVSNIEITATDQASPVLAAVGRQADAAATQIEAAGRRISGAMVGARIAPDGLGLSAISADADRTAGAVEVAARRMNGALAGISGSDAVGALRDLQAQADLTGASLAGIANSSTLVDDAFGGVVDTSTEAKMGLSAVGAEAESAASALARLSGAGGELQAGLIGVSGKLDGLQGSLEALGLKLEAIGSRATLFGAEMARAGGSAFALRDGVVSLNPELDPLGAGLGNSAKEGDALAAALAATGERATADLDPIRALTASINALADANERARTTGAGVGTTPPRPTRGAGFGSAYDSTAHGFRTVGLGAGVLAGVSLFEDVRYQKAFQAAGANAGLSEPVIRAVASAALPIFASNPVPYTDLATAYQRAAEEFQQHAGESATAYARRLTTIVREALRSGVGTGANVGDVAQILSKIEFDFGLSQGQSQHAMDITHLVGALGGNMSLQDLSQYFGRPVASGANLGFSLPQIGSLFDVLSKQFGPQQAGTYLNGLFQHILTQSKGSRTMLAAIGMSSEWSQTGAEQYGPFKLIADLVSHAQAYQQATHGQVTVGDVLQAVVPGYRGGLAVQSLMRSGHLQMAERLAERLGGTTGHDISPLGSGNHAGVYGITARQYAGMMHQPAAEMETAWNSAKASMMLLGQDLAPAAVKAARALDRLAGAVGSFAKQHPTAASDLIIGALGLGAVGLGMRVGKDVFGGAQALGRGAVGLARFAGFGPEVDAATGAVGSAGRGALGLLGSVPRAAAGGLGDLAGLEFLPALFPTPSNKDISGGGAAWAGVAASAGGAFSGLESHIHGAVQGLQDFVALLGKLPNDQQAVSAIGATFSRLGSTIHGALATIGSDIGTTFSHLGGTIHTGLGQIGTDVGGMLSGVGSAVHSGLAGIASSFTGFAGQVIRGYGALFGTLGGIVHGGLAGLSSAFGSGFSAIGATVHRALAAITAAAGGFFSGLGALARHGLSVFSSLFHSAAATISTTAHGMASTVISTVSGLVGGVVKWFAGLPGMLAGPLGGLKDGITTAATDAVGGVMGALGHLKGDITAWLGTETQDFLKWGGSLPGAVAEGIKSDAGKIKDALANAVTAAVHYVEGLPVVGGLIHALAGGSGSSSGSGGGAGPFGLPGYTGTVTQMENEGGLIGTSGYVNDRDYLLPHGAQDRIYFPGGRNQTYTVLPSSPGGGLGSNNGISGIEEVAGPNGRFALVHLSQTVRPGTYHGGQYAGTTGWPTNPNYGNGVAGPGNAQLCVVYNSNGDPVALVPVSTVAHFRFGVGGGAASAPVGSTAWLASQYGAPAPGLTYGQARGIYSSIGNTLPDLYKQVMALPNQKEQQKLLTGSGGLEAIAADYQKVQTEYAEKIKAINTAHEDRMRAIDDGFTTKVGDLYAAYNIKETAGRDRFLTSEAATYQKANQSNANILARYGIEQTAAHETLIAGLTSGIAKANGDQAKIAALVTTAAEKFGISQQKAAELLHLSLKEHGQAASDAVNKLAAMFHISTSEAKAMLDLSIQKAGQSRDTAITKEKQGYEAHITGLKQAFEAHVAALNEKLVSFENKLQQLGSPDQLFQQEGQNYSAQLKAAVQGAAYMVEHGDVTTTSSTTTAANMTWGKGVPGMPGVLIDPLTGQPFGAMGGQPVGSVNVTGTHTTTTTTSAIGAAVAAAVQAVQGQNQQTLAQSDVQAQVDAVTGDLSDLGKQFKAVAGVLQNDLYAEILKGQPVTEAYITGLQQIAQAQADAQIVQDSLTLRVDAASGDLAGMGKDIAQISADVLPQWTEAVAQGAGVQNQYTPLLVAAAKAQQDLTTATNEQNVVVGELTGNAKMLSDGLQGLFKQAGDAVSFWIDDLGRGGDGISTAAGNIATLGANALSAATNLGSISDIVKGIQADYSQMQDAAGTEVARTGTIDPAVLQQAGIDFATGIGAQADALYGKMATDRSAGNLVAFDKDLHDAVTLFQQKLGYDLRNNPSAAAQDTATIQGLQKEATQFDAAVKKLDPSAKMAATDLANANAALAIFQSNGVDPATTAIQGLTQQFPVTAGQMAAFQTATQTTGQDVNSLGTAAESVAGAMTGRLLPAITGLAGAMVAAINTITNGSKAAAAGATGTTLNQKPGPVLIGTESSGSALGGTIYRWQMPNGTIVTTNSSTPPGAPTITPPIPSFAQRAAASSIGGDTTGAANGAMAGGAQLTWPTGNATTTGGATTSAVPTVPLGSQSNPYSSGSAIPVATPDASTIPGGQTDFYNEGYQDAVSGQFAKAFPLPNSPIAQAYAMGYQAGLKVQRAGGGVYVQGQPPNGSSNTGGVQIAPGITYMGPTPGGGGSYLDNGYWYTGTAWDGVMGDVPTLKAYTKRPTPFGGGGGGGNHVTGGWTFNTPTYGTGLGNITAAGVSGLTSAELRRIGHYQEEIQKWAAELKIAEVRERVHPTKTLEKHIATLSAEITKAGLAIQKIEDSSRQTAKNTKKTATGMDPVAWATAFWSLARQLLNADTANGVRMVGSALSGLDAEIANFGLVSTTQGI